VCHGVGAAAVVLFGCFRAMRHSVATGRGTAWAFSLVSAGFRLRELS
jgi:hypothetical protein